MCRLKSRLIPAAAGVAKARIEADNIVLAMLVGELDLLEGSQALRHRLFTLGWDLGMETEIIAHASDLARDFPSGEARRLWDAEALARRDEERAECLDRLRPSLLWTLRLIQADLLCG